MVKHRSNLLRPLVFLLVDHFLPFPRYRKFERLNISMNDALDSGYIGVVGHGRFSFRMVIFFGLVFWKTFGLSFGLLVRAGRKDGVTLFFFVEYMILIW